jgi:hypothetical protein
MSQCNMLIRLRGSDPIGGVRLVVVYTVSLHRVTESEQQGYFHRGIASFVLQRRANVAVAGPTRLRAERGVVDRTEMCGLKPPIRMISFTCEFSILCTLFQGVIMSI